MDIEDPTVSFCKEKASYAGTLEQIINFCSNLQGALHQWHKQLCPLANHPFHSRTEEEIHNVGVNRCLWVVVCLWVFKMSFLSCSM